MPLVDADTVKLHLRVDSSDEDALIAIWIGTAEQQVCRFLNCNVYADQATLDAAVDAAPEALAAATAAYASAIDAAALLDAGVGKDAAIRYAEENFAAAQEISDMDQRGVVVNDTVKAALLLTVGALYAHRGDGAEGEPPPAARALLMPYRVGMGV